MTGKTMPVSRTYIEGSMPAYNLKNYYQHFDKSQIKIIFPRPTAKDLHGTLRTLFEFLGVQPDFRCPTPSKRTLTKIEDQVPRSHTW